MTQIPALLNRADPIGQQLRAAWRANEVAGNLLFDATGQGAVMVGASIPNWSPGERFTTSAGSMSFTNVNSIMTATVPNLNSLTAFSMMFDMKANASGSPQFSRVIEKGANQDWGFCINRAVNDNKLFVQSGNGTNFLQSTAVVCDATWKRILVTMSWSGTTITTNIYINGEPSGSGSWTDTSNTGTQVINLNQFSGSIGAFSFRGQLKNILGWSRILTPNEAFLLYQQPWRPFVAPQRNVAASFLTVRPRLVGWI